MEKILIVENLKISYSGQTAVSGVDFEIKQGGILGIVGESGSGKSTIIKACMGILGENATIDEGRIIYRNQDLLGEDGKIIKRLRGNELSMIFQDSRAALCPVRKIGQQMYDALLTHQKTDKQSAKHKISDILCKLALQNPERILNSYPFELSGGMCQRVGIAMSLMMDPVLIFADEPTSALDAVVTKQVAAGFKAVVEETKTSMVMVTHDIGLVKNMADKVMVLENGVVREYGDTQSVISNPQNEYTKKLLKSVLKLQI